MIHIVGELRRATPLQLRARIVGILGIPLARGVTYLPHFYDRPSSGL